MISNNLKEAAPLIWAEVEEAKNILLHCHVNPDSDSVGSAMATRQILLNLGKQVTVIKGDSDLPNWAKFFPGGEEIELKNIFEVDLTKFDLFIAQDSSDLQRISMIGEISFPSNLRVVNIDHHASNTNFGHLNLVLTDRPATSQILFELYKEWGVEITKPVAQCLMIGINSDTGGFIHRGTSSETFKIAGELAAIAPDFSKLINDVYGVASLKRIKFMGQMMSQVELFLGGRVVIAGMSYDEFTKLNLTNKQEIKQTGLSNMLRNIEGVLVSFLLVEEDPGVTGVSARSRDGEKYDVAKLLSQFGGGGHKAAAGAHINKPLAEAKADLLKALTSLLQ